MFKGGMTKSWRVAEEEGWGAGGWEGSGIVGVAAAIALPPHRNRLAVFNRAKRI